MNLKDNLRKIRKDNNLSQEDLAEKLGVSRQSVSKWESGSAYPEMDKVIQICNMFNLNIDELLNQDINKVEKTKQSKVDIGKYVDDFLCFFNKTINMFSSMKFKDIIKCLFEQLIVFLILLLMFNILGNIFYELFSTLNAIIPDKIYYIIYDILRTLYSAASTILGLILMIQVFKTRYLNYYTIIDKADTTEEDKENENNLEENNYQKKEGKIINNTKEKIIIRDPNHSEYKFIKGLLKVMLFGIKLFVSFIALFFCASFVFFVVCLVLSFLITKTGLLFLGIVLSIIAALLLNYALLNIMYNFIVNKRISKTLIGLFLISSLIIGGLGIGLSVIGFKDFNYIKIPKEEYLVTKEQNIKMNSKLYFSSNYYKINFIEEDRKDIKIETAFIKGFEVIFQQYENSYEIYRTYNQNDFEVFRTVIKGINKKEIVDMDYYNINIYASKANIKTLKENYNKTYSNIDYD